MHAAPGENAIARGLRVLVVDDSELNREIALAQLAELGCEAEAAENGRDALAKLEGAAFDAVLMDCEMPVLDGFQATAELRRREGARRRTWMIAMTASEAPGQREACVAVGMDDFLVKPAPPGALAAALGKVPVERAAVDRGVLESKGLSALFPKLAEIFLRDAPVQIQAAREGFVGADLVAVGKAAHALKGMAGNFGATELASHCGELEQAARAGATNLGALLDGVEREFGRVCAELTA